MQQIEVTRLKARLWNWGRWARPDSVDPGECASAERRFVAARPDDEALQRSAQVPIDPEDAERIEAAVCRLRCENDRRLLKMFYVDGRSSREIARKLRVPDQLLEPFHLRVLGALIWRVSEIEREGARSPRRAGSCARDANGYINLATT